MGNWSQRTFEERMKGICCLLLESCVSVLSLYRESKEFCESAKKK